MLTFRPPSQLKRCCWAWVNKSYSMSQVWSCNTSTWGTNHPWFLWCHPDDSTRDMQTKTKHLFSSNDEEEATRQSAIVAVWSARFPSEWCYHSICGDASMKPQLYAIHHVTANCVGLARQDSKWQADMHISSTHEHTYSCSPSGLQVNLKGVAEHESINHIPCPKSDHATPQLEEQIINGSYGATLMTAHVICKQKPSISSARTMRRKLRDNRQLWLFDQRDSLLNAVIIASVVMPQWNHSSMRYIMSQLTAPILQGKIRNDKLICALLQHMNTHAHAHLQASKST